MQLTALVDFINHDILKFIIIIIFKIKLMCLYWQMKELQIQIEWWYRAAQLSLWWEAVNVGHQVYDSHLCPCKHIVWIYWVKYVYMTSLSVNNFFTKSLYKRKYNNFKKCCRGFPEGRNLYTKSSQKCHLSK